MNILFVSAEVSPYAKVGGLADVAGSLPQELRRKGHDVRIVMPLYAMVDADPRFRLETVCENVPIAINAHWIELATVKTACLEGVPVYFVGHERFFRQAKSSERIYTPGIEKYLFFTCAVLELPELLSWSPDIVHANDWHTGFVPVLMRERYEERFAQSAAVFTIHNLAYQGEFGVEILDALALPRSLFVPEYLETWGGVNFLKSGCVYSRHVNTVSPTYAQEIQTAAFGCRLEGLMRHLSVQGRLSGILNGIGTDRFDPETDPALPFNYSVSNPTGKARCKDELMREIGMEPAKNGLLAGAVTRISSQKGLTVLAEAAPKLFELPIQLVIQGLGDPSIIHDLRRLQNRYPNHMRFFEKFDEGLAQRIYAGCDLFAMPSRFEPCGLGQLIALRYGTVPVVHATGGLADTVFDGLNGFVAREDSTACLVDAFARAHQASRSPDKWAAMIHQAMTVDYGWSRSASLYEEMYDAALDSLGEAELKLA